MEAAQVLSEVAPGLGTTAARHAAIRSYRQGVGDCHLVILHGDGGRTYSILIDCGVARGTQNERDVMRAIMQDVVHLLEPAGAQLDLLVATHEHWDHLSGFVQADDVFSQLTVRETWMGWTENPFDPQANCLRAQRDHALGKLRLAAAHMQLRAEDGDAGTTAMMREFLGAAGQATSRHALEAVRAKSGRVRYLDPREAPVELPGFGARIYVLGPPRNEASLRKILPAGRDADPCAEALAAFESSVLPVLAGESADNPFSSLYAIPESSARGIDFFQQHYWAAEPWRRVGLAWMGDASELALALDSLTNNTSLALAIELDGVGVLLFAADAQIGSWQSWRELAWKVGERDVTGPDLLARTAFYKVGHHGCFNASEQALVAATERNGGYVLPADQDPPSAAQRDQIQVQVSPDYVEVQLRADARAPIG